MSTHRFSFKFSITSLFLALVAAFMTFAAIYSAKRCLSENRRANEWRAIAEKQATEILNLRVSAKIMAIQMLSATNQPSTNTAK